MHADFDLEPDGHVRATRGGRREGAGRPPGYSPKKAREMQGGDTPDGEEPNQQTNATVRKAIATAAKAEWDAKQAELNYKVDAKEYLSRGAFREASATLLAELAQGLRSIPDTLERKFGLAPDVVLAIQTTLDERMQAVADGLELFHGGDD